MLILGGIGNGATLRDKGKREGYKSSICTELEVGHMRGFIVGHMRGFMVGHMRGCVVGHVSGCVVGHMVGHNHHDTEFWICIALHIAAHPEVLRAFPRERFVRL